ncbi:MAG: tetratricopeptide repeat protein [Nostocaceae cyanobacterium]|nr:tetratricopeptide repeat protein [Nostocaceae cyanobacterium]
MGRFEDAIADYSSAIEIQPDFHPGCSKLGNALDNLRRFEDAIASFSSAIEIQPDFHPAWYGRGVAAGKSVSCDPFLASQSRIARENPKLNQRGYEGELVSYEEGLKYLSPRYAPGRLGKVTSSNRQSSLLPRTW